MSFQSLPSSSMVEQQSKQKSTSSIARRREQNRLAQARRRKRKETLIEELQEKVNQLCNSNRERDRLILKLYNHLKNLSQEDSKRHDHHYHHHHKRSSISALINSKTFTSEANDRQNIGSSSSLPNSFTTEGQNYDLNISILDTISSTSENTLLPPDWQTTDSNHTTTTFDQIMSDLNIESILQDQIVQKPLNLIDENRGTSYEEAISDSMSLNNSTPLSTYGSLDEATNLTPSPELQTFPFLPLTVDQEKMDGEEGKDISSTMETFCLNKIFDILEKDDRNLLKRIVYQKHYQHKQQLQQHSQSPSPTISSSPSSSKQSNPMQTWRYNLPYSY